MMKRKKKENKNENKNKKEWGDCNWLLWPG